LRLRKPRHGRQRGDTRGELQKLSTAKFHSIPRSRRDAQC
jgi:hypothetical protein